MEFVMPILEGAWRYVLTLRISDYLDTVSYTHLTLPTNREV